MLSAALETTIERLGLVLRAGSLGPGVIGWSLPLDHGTVGGQQSIGDSEQFLHLGDYEPVGGLSTLGRASPNQSCANP